MKKIMFFLSISALFLVNASALATNPKANFGDKSDSQIIRPEFPGGTDALFHYIEQNLKYPKEAIAHAKTGTVQVSFKINKQGEAVHFKIVQALEPFSDRAALAVLKKMPKL